MNISSLHTLIRLGVVSAFILLFFALIAPKDLSPYWNHDIDTANVLSFSRNIERLPIAQTGLMNTWQVTDLGLPIMSGEEGVTYYPDHPPLLQWLLACILHFFKNNIFSGRLLHILASLLTVLFTALAAREFLGPGAFWISALIIVSTRVFWRHGVVLNYEPSALMWMTVAAYYFGCYLKSTRTRAWICASVFWTLGLLTEWPAYMMAPVLFLCMVSRKEYKKAIFALLWPILLVTAIVLSYGIHMNTPLWFFSFVSGVSGVLMPQASGALQQYAWPHALREIVRHFLDNYTWILAMFAVISGLIALFRSKSLTPPARLFLSLLFSAALLNVILFKPWAVDHAFWNYYFLSCVGFVVPAAFTVFVPKIRRIFFYGILSVLICVFLFNLKVVYRQSEGIRQMTSEDMLRFAPFRDNSIRYFSKDAFAMKAFGAVERWYLDRQLLPLPDSEKSFSKSDYVVIPHPSPLLEKLKSMNTGCQLTKLITWHIASLADPKCRIVLELLRQ